MTSGLWTTSGESLSHKNACKEYGLDESEILDAIRSGKLQYKINYAHGNPYYKLLRTEVKSLAIELKGANHAQRQAIEFKLHANQKEINACRRKLKALEKENLALAQQLEQLDRSST